MKISEQMVFFKLSLFEQTVSILLYIAVLVIFGAITVNFIISKEGSQSVEKRKLSIVDTFSMAAFFVVFLLLCLKNVGRIDINAFGLHPIFPYVITIIGLILIYAGIAINITGRLYLKKNWGNQINIYQDHQLITRGIYRYIRHPLYSSTILMFYGTALVYVNGLVVLLTLVAFTPFMILRAKQEEALLIAKFPEYQKYRSETGMFFPRILRRSK